MWSFPCGGVRVEPHLQRYSCSRDPHTLRGELLSRPEGHDRVEEFLSALDYGQHIELLTSQLEIKEELGRSPGFHVSINVDNAIVANDQQQRAFVDLLSRYPTPATLEFTETQPMPPVLESNRLLRQVRELGYVTALDDFGTGLNGMSLLTDYDFDVIKVDRSLISDIDERVTKRKTIKLILQMLDVLGKRHVVEGIESEEVHRILARQGFTTFQGYVFHRPAPVAVAIAEADGDVRTAV